MRMFVTALLFLSWTLLATPHVSGNEFAWEDNDLDELFESDIKLQSEQLLALEATGDVDGHVGGFKRGIAKDRNILWPNGVVPYIVDDDLADNADAMGALHDGFDEWQTQTCIRFVKRTTEENYVNFFGAGGGCWSYVGRIGGKQNISLAPGCWQRGTVTHEIAHALGFWHEQSRPDRDDFVEIVWQNIPEQRRHNFRKYNRTIVDSLGSPYDYISVMHYSSTAFGGGGNITIRSKDPDAVQLGQRAGLTPHDIYQADALYQCHGHTTISTPPPPTVPPPPSGLYDCTFETDTCGFLNMQGDDFDWQVRISGTPSGGTGPLGDHTRYPNYRFGRYVYIEASLPRKENDTALFQSPVYPPFGQKCFHFYYHMFGEHMGELNVYTKNYGDARNLVFSRRGDQANAWHLAKIQLSGSHHFQIIFEGIRGSDYRGDIAIDDLFFTDGECN